MAKLIIKLDTEVIDHIELRQGDMKVGRKPGCDIFLDNLAVSGEHANIFTIGDDSFIQDLNSTNGTFINNKRITKHHLRMGDTVAIGKYSLVYLTEQKEVRDEEYAKTVVINPTSAAAPAPAPSSYAPAAPAARTAPTAPQGALFILSGANSGKRLELTKAVTNLGKTGRHAGTITQTAGGYVLAGGPDGEPPKLNGRAIGDEGTKLRNGDIIEVSGTRLQFYQK